MAVTKLEKRLYALLTEEQRELLREEVLAETLENWASEEIGPSPSIFMEIGSDSSDEAKVWRGKEARALSEIRSLHGKTDTLLFGVLLKRARHLKPFLRIGTGNESEFDEMFREFAVGLLNVSDEIASRAMAKQVVDQLTEQLSRPPYRIVVYYAWTKRFNRTQALFLKMWSDPASLLAISNMFKKH